MKTLLHIDSSVQTANSVSRQLSANVVDRWVDDNPDIRVVTRDLSAQPLPHADETLTSAFFISPEERDDDQVRAIAKSDELVDELIAADVIVIGVPMYNFGIPSTLKAWIDHVARAGRTFKYTDQGPQGLLQAKQAVIVSARGGQYTGSPLDHQEPYLQTVLNFIGIDDISFVRAEGLAMGGDTERSLSIQSAIDSIRKLAIA